MKPRCAAGIEYPKGQAIPCIEPFSPNVKRPECPCYQAKGIEQVKKEEKEFETMSVNVTRARLVIMSYTKGKPNVQGSIECPICREGTLNFMVAYNGHCHAACTTKGCVNWME